MKYPFKLYFEIMKTDFQTFFVNYITFKFDN